MATSPAPTTITSAATTPPPPTTGQPPRAAPPHRPDPHPHRSVAHGPPLQHTPHNNDAPRRPTERASCSTAPRNCAPNGGASPSSVGCDPDGRPQAAARPARRAPRGHDLSVIIHVDGPSATGKSISSSGCWPRCAAAEHPVRPTVSHARWWRHRDDRDRIMVSNRPCSSPPSGPAPSPSSGCATAPVVALPC